VTGKTHLTGGLTFGLLVGQALQLINADAILIGNNTLIPVTLVAIAGIAFGSLLPDIDEPNAMVSNLPKKGRGVVNTALKKKGIEGILRGLITVILLGLNLVTRAIAGGVKTLVGHRGATHWVFSSVMVGILFAVAGFFFGYPELGLWIWLGYISHILLDAMTLSGVEMWQPFIDKKYHLLPQGFRVRTGNFVDAGMSLIFGMIAALLIYIALLPIAQQTVSDLPLPQWLGGWR